MIAFGGLLMMFVGAVLDVAIGPETTGSVARIVCLALYFLLILSAGVFEWLLRIRN
jgi:hypothetical protein